MTDETPFAPFVPQPPMFEGETAPPPTTKPASAKGSRRKAEAAKKAAAPKAKKASAPKPATVAPAAPLPTKRTRAPRKPRAFKVDLTAAMSALSGVKPEDTRLLGQMVAALQGLRAPSRKRIVAALASIFA